MTANEVRVEVDDGVATIRIDRPPVNALNAAVQDALGEAARRCSEDPGIAAVVITGGDRNFAAGVDVKELARYDHADIAERSSLLHAAFTAIAHIPKPVVAAVNGFALGGGCELALCADRRIAASNATLGQPEIALGVIPGAGGTQRLARLIGPARAKELIFTGRHVDAAQALALGLVDEVVEPDQVQARAIAWARQFVGGPAAALGAAKEAVDLGIDVGLDAALEIERHRFVAMFSTADRAEGMAAFLGKRAPQFRGR